MSNRVKKDAKHQWHRSHFSRIKGKRYHTPTRVRSK